MEIGRQTPEPDRQRARTTSTGTKKTPRRSSIAAGAVGSMLLITPRAVNPRNHAYP
jgi:hypothetical protein